MMQQNLLHAKNLLILKIYCFIIRQQGKTRYYIYLTDIFTVWSSSDKIEPWLFSDSINGILGLPRVEVDDIKKRKEQIDSMGEKF